MSSRIMDNICLLFCFIVFCNYVIFMTKILQFKEKTDLSEYTKWDCINKTSDFLYLKKIKIAYRKKSGWTVTAWELLFDHVVCQTNVFVAFFFLLGTRDGLTVSKFYEGFAKEP